jgi:4-hydroxybenzoate polyprenyltransferase
MSGRATYWLATVLILAGAALSWIGWLGDLDWVGLVGTMVMLVGAIYLLVTRRRRA